MTRDKTVKKRGPVVFVTGGARSGKSSFALRAALSSSGRRAFIATARETDEEMRQRIEKHRADRGPGWDTFEEPFNIVDLIKRIESCYSVIVIDCLTLWLSNLMLSEMETEPEIDRFIDSLKGLSTSIFIVSNEVGMGIVPDNELARRFRDIAGRLNQMVAEVADSVYLMVSGIPVKVK